MTQIPKNTLYPILIHGGPHPPGDCHSLYYYYKCQSKWSDRSLIRNFSRKRNILPIEIRKEKTKNKFKEKLSSEMVKLHERVPIDRQVRGFRNLFY